jgi:uncharacterized protein (TIGR03435 family)
MIRMTTGHCTRNLNPNGMLILLTAASLLFATPIAPAQSSAHTLPCIPDPGAMPTAAAAIPTLTYDVASIRPHAAGDGSLSIRDAPREARYSITGMTIKNVIEEAYGVQDFQVTGGPAWLDSEHFDIQAESDSSVNDQLAKLNSCDAHYAKQLMLQALLAGRLKLTVHRGTKETTGFDLVIAKSGPKLQESKPPAPDDDPAKAFGGMSIYRRKQGYELTAQNYPMPLVASWLISAVHGPVTDKTGLTAKYDLKLQYSDQDAASSRSPQDEAWPSLFTALQEQLGLKLQPAKVPVETIIIDHIEHPSEN